MNDWANDLNHLVKDIITFPRDTINQIPYLFAARKGTLIAKFRIDVVSTKKFTGLLTFSEHSWYS